MRPLLIALLLAAHTASAGWLSSLWRQEANLPRVTAVGEVGPTEPGTLKMWLRMSATDTGAYIADASGNGNYLTQGTASAQCTIANGYAAFDGGDYADTTNSALFNGATQVLICAWVYPTNWVDYAGIMVSRGSTLNGLAVEDSVSKKVVGYAAIGVGYGPIPMSNWTHVAFWASLTTPQSACKVGTWTNNVWKGWYASSWPASLSVNDVWRLGWDDGTAGRKFKGYIDDVRMHLLPSSTNIIQQIYNEGRR